MSTLNRKSNYIVQKILFIISALIIKVVLMGIFSSDYQKLMFEPFVSVFLSGKNPYDYYYTNNLISSFPYFPLMLLIESIGGFIVKLFSVTDIFVTNILFKFPLLIFDCISYTVIRKMGVRFKYAYVFYFCSPIILYGTYMHGQLDIIPTTFLIIAVYFLLDWKRKGNLFLYALFLGFALSTKSHILAAVPVLFLYLLKKRNILSALIFHVISIAVVAMFTLPFWCKGFVQTVVFNKEQSLLFATKLDYGFTQILIPILALILIYFSVFELNYFNRNLLVSVMGLLFAVFLVCLPPMPAWFTWIVPFIALYFGYVEENKYKVMYLYLLFNTAYIFYFIFLHKLEYVDLYFFDISLQIIKYNEDSIKFVVFTIMTACLGVIVYKIYRFGLATNSLYQRRDKSFTIGIAGDSGAGKSQMLEKIKNLFGSGKDILFIEGDGDHKWARGDENWEQYTALDPKANYLYRQAEDIRKLKSGIYVDRTEYDHNRGIFTEKQRITPKKYVVLSGLHSLYLPKLRNLIDLKIYMDTDEKLRVLWKIKRDMLERDYPKDKIIDQIKKRHSDAEKYIYPQKQYADLVISYFDKTLNDCYDETHEIKLSVKFVLTMDLDVELLLKDLRRSGVETDWRISDDFYHQEIVFDSESIESAKLDYEKLAERNIVQYEDFFTYKPVWGNDGLDGIIQLMLLFVISERMRV